MAFLFTPPTVDETIGGHPLFWNRVIKKGVTVYKIGNAYYENQYPSQDELDEAELVYLGGHEYYVTPGEKTDLESAGYTVSTV